MAAASSVPVGFHYETKYIVLSVLGSPSLEVTGGDLSAAAPGVLQPLCPPAPDKEVLERIKAEVEEVLKCLEEEISAVFPSTGFDTHTSPVFSPVNPETSIEDCLTLLMERMCLQIRESLDEASATLLSAAVTYDAFKKESDNAAVHTTGWNKVLVPLFLLQRLLLEETRRGRSCLEELVRFGVSYIEKECSNYIIQQGGWGAVFSQDVEEDDVSGLSAEDGNDIYILPEQASPPESLTVSSSWHTESLPVSSSWHTESLPTSLGPESWQQVAMDPEELKSLDSNGGGEERSENNSSNSDIVHVEKEEIAEVLEEAAVVEQRLEQREEEEAAVVEQREEEVEGEERELLVLPPAVLTSALLPPTREEDKIPPPPATQPEPPAADVQGVLEKEPPGPPEESKEEMAVTPTSEAEKADPPAASQPISTGEDKPVLLPEGKSILLYGGAAAVAILAVAVGMVMALRKK